MATKKLDAGEQAGAKKAPKLVNLMSRKEFPIVLTLKDGSKVKLTRNKVVTIRADNLPDKLPPGILAY